MRERPKFETGRNREAVEAIVKDLDERGLLDVADGPLVEVARSLASAVDREPASSQLALQYRQAVEQLRTEVQRLQDDEARQLMWFLNTGCEEHASMNMHHCDPCCRRSDGWDEVATWDSIHIPDDKLDDARSAIYLFLQRPRS
jgi:hypothetical protein